MSRIGQVQIVRHDHEILADVSHNHAHVDYLSTYSNLRQLIMHEIKDIESLCAAVVMGIFAGASFKAAPFIDNTNDRMDQFSRTFLVVTPSNAHRGSCAKCRKRHWMVAEYSKSH